MNKTYRAAWESPRQKSSDKWDHYFEIYDHLLGRFYSQEVSYLEIGVQHGGGLETARKLFHENSKIIGLDIDPVCKSLETEGVADLMIIGSQIDPDALRIAKDASPDGFDIILDDGSHVQSHMVSTFIQMFSHLKNGGIYIIEDTHTNYSWEHQEGFFAIGVYDFFKGVSERLNLEFMNADFRANRFKQPRESRTTVPQPDPFLKEVFSIEFFNSVIAIRKKLQPEVMRVSR